MPKFTLNTTSNNMKREQFLSDLKDLLDMHDDNVYCGGFDGDKEFQAELDLFIEKHAPEKEE